MQKAFIKLLSILLPGVVTNLAYRQLTNPQIRKLRDNEIDTLNKAEKNVLPFKGFDIQTYKWGSGSESVLLIHGWEGQAGNFSDLIEKLLENNYTVYAFDGPSHGFSSKGKTSLFEFTELVGVCIEKFNVRKLISHSFGGVATTYALKANKDLKMDKYVLITTPDRFSERIDEVAMQVGITDKVQQRLIDRLENETQIPVKTMNVSDFVKEVNVERAIIFHDEDDRVIPIRLSQNVQKNWPNCEMRVVKGTGHFRILRDDAVLNEIVAFLGA